MVFGIYFISKLVVLQIPVRKYSSLSCIISASLKTLLFYFLLFFIKILIIIIITIITIIIIIIKVITIIKK